MGKNKRNDAAARARRENKQRARKARGAQPRRHFVERNDAETAHRLPAHQVSVLGNVHGADRCHPPIFIGPGCIPASDPFQVLRLDSSRRPTPDEVEAAARTALASHPPERDPDAAREILEARDRLQRPNRILDRELGVLYLPDPNRFDLPSELPPRAARQKPKASPMATPVQQASDASLVPSRARLLAAMALYALVEDELI